MTEPNSSPTKIRLIPLAIFIGVALTLVGTGYIVVKNFLRQRQAILSYKTLPPRPVLDRPEMENGREVRTYSAKELEEARKKGKLPPGMATMPLNQANMANEAAVQRSLRTLDEINKINQMNQRLLDQQQRMQRTK